MQTLNIGDWVRLKRNGRILKWTAVDELFPERVLEVDLWQPLPNEYCWFWNDPSSEVVLGKFHFETSNLFCYENTCGVTKVAKFCQPFIGDLPTCRSF